MQNYTKSQTRLAFVQYIFQNEFLDTDSLESIDDFQKHFYDTNIAIIDEKKEIKLKFNKNFLNRLFSSLKNNINKKNITEDLNSFIDINRRFEKWDNILKSIIIKYERIGARTQDPQVKSLMLYQLSYTP